MGNKQDIMPSETEWLVMEILWASDIPLPSSEIIQRLKRTKDLSPKTVRVLLNRLYQKNMVDYTVDPKDSRVYHYFPKRTKEECQQEKSRQFAQSYFAGNQMGALASLVEAFDLTEEQMQALREILGQKK